LTLRVQAGFGEPGRGLLGGLPLAAVTTAAVRGIHRDQIGSEAHDFGLST
jgi:hypothetical protein